MKNLKLALILFVSLSLINCTGSAKQEDSDNVVVLQSESDFDKIISGSTTVIVDFYADWCRPCKMQGPILQETASEMNGKIIVLKVNVDKFPDIARRYQVTGIPSLIMFNKGEHVWDAVGLQEKETIISAYKLNT